jgi:hypothetical protein
MQWTHAFITGDSSLDALSPMSPNMPDINPDRAAVTVFDYLNQLDLWFLGGTDGRGWS